MLSEAVARRLACTIDVHEAHVPGSLPVSITQILRQQNWEILYRERIYPVYGGALIGRRARGMLINADLPAPWQRFVMAHELGHVIAEHPGSFYLFSADNWMHHKQEREASIIAAHLLIPEWALSEYGAERDLTAACDVPGEALVYRMQEPLG